MGFARVIELNGVYAFHIGEVNTIINELSVFMKQDCFLFYMK